MIEAEDFPHWHDMEIALLRAQRIQDQEIVEEQITWWRDNCISPSEAHEALYGKSQIGTTWQDVKQRMYRNFV
ncbi:MAG: hypothetical protein ACR2QC_04135 [Gammaproteobacteria bacterium]